MRTSPPFVCCGNQPSNPFGLGVICPLGWDRASLADVRRRWGRMPGSRFRRMILGTLDGLWGDYMWYVLTWGCHETTCDRPEVVMSKRSVVNTFWPEVVMSKRPLVTHSNHRLAWAWVRSSLLQQRELGFHSHRNPLNEHLLSKPSELTDIPSMLNADIVRIRPDRKEPYIRQKDTPSVLSPDYALLSRNQSP